MVELSSKAEQDRRVGLYSMGTVLAELASMVAAVANCTVHVD